MDTKTIMAAVKIANARGGGGGSGGSAATDAELLDALIEADAIPALVWGGYLLAIDNDVCII